MSPAPARAAYHFEGTTCPARALHSRTLGSPSYLLPRLTTPLPTTHGARALLHVPHAVLRRYAACGSGRSMAVAGGLALVGCGDGSLHVVDIKVGQTLYALGAGQAAVRTIDACADRMVVSGDDGNALLYRFSDSD